MANISVETAEAYRAAGLSCLPARRQKKRPAIGGWKTWQSRLPTAVETRAWFSNPHDAVCIVAGGVSGNLECIDFDNHGELFAAWMERIDTGLLAKLVIEQTPSGGYHVCYRVDGPVEGNLKLARGVRDGKDRTLIETRGEGGLFLCAPTEGYSLQQGDFAHLATITPDTRKALLDAARSLDELPAANPPPAPAGANVGQPCADFAPTGGKEGFDLAPGDDFNARGDIRPLLTGAGWQFSGARPDGNEDWTRPGKDPRRGISATYKDGCFYVFSSNAAPFEPNVKYSPFAVYATLRHNGDFTAAAADLLAHGYGKPKEAALGVALNLKPTASAPGTGQAAGTGQANDDDEFMDACDILEKYTELRPVLIDGYLRVGEIMNLIAAPKTGKTWFVLALAIHVATGRDWLGHTCNAGRVLIIDNELHRETSSQRLRIVLKALGIPPSEIRGRITFWHLRGKWKSVHEIGARADWFREQGYKLIITDAFYRALPAGTDENDNGAIAGIYNAMDVYAQRIGCAFIFIHHTAKGNQSQKSVTDVGAGAGAQSRAADTHMTLREHKDDGYLVLESAVRSFPKQEPIVLKMEFPLMVPDYAKDPTDLAGKAEPRPRRRTAAETADETESIAHRLAELVDKDDLHTTKQFLLDIARAYGCTRDMARDALSRALELGILLAERRANVPVALRNAKFIVTPELSEGGANED